MEHNIDGKRSGTFASEEARIVGQPEKALLPFKNGSVKLDLALFDCPLQLAIFCLGPCLKVVSDPILLDTGTVSEICHSPNHFSNIEVFIRFRKYLHESDQAIFPHLYYQCTSLWVRFEVVLKNLSTVYVRSPVRFSVLRNYRICWSTQEPFVLPLPASQDCHNG